MPILRHDPPNDLYHGMKKTRKKTLPLHLVPGNPGNSGGKKGRSGRKPNDFVAWCRSVTDDPIVRDVNLARAKAGDIKVLTLAASYAHGKPKEQVEVRGSGEGGTIPLSLKIFDASEPDG